MLSFLEGHGCPTFPVIVLNNLKVKLSPASIVRTGRSEKPVGHTFLGLASSLMGGTIGDSAWGAEMQLGREGQDLVA